MAKQIGQCRKECEAYLVDERLHLCTYKLINSMGPPFCYSRTNPGDPCKQGLTYEQIRGLNPKSQSSPKYTESVQMTGKDITSRCNQQWYAMSNRKNQELNEANLSE